MIIKSLRHKIRQSQYSVNYVFDGMPKEQAERWLVFQNIQNGFTRKSIIEEFNTNAHFLHDNLKRSKTIRYHEVLAFAHENSSDLNREKLQAITHQYLKLRDPKGSAMALAVPHHEKHSHIHILLTSNSLGSSKSGDMMMTNAQYYDIRREMERWVLKTYPELHRSTVYLSKEEIHELLPEQQRAERRLMELEKPKVKNGTAKERVSKTVKQILEKSSSLQDFIERMNKPKEFQTYSRKGKLTGIIHDNKKKYRFSNLGINLMEENFTVLSRMQELENLEPIKSSNSLER